MDRDDMIGEFSLDRVKKSDAAFDMKKLAWINGKLIREMAPDKLLQAARPYLEHAGLVTKTHDEKWLIDALQTVRDKLDTLNHAVDEMRVYLELSPETETEAVEILDDPDTQRVLDALLSELEKCIELSLENVRDMIKSAGENAGVTGKPLYLAVRAAVSGRTHGPALPGMMAVLGKDKVIQRIKAALGGQCST
jgi:nondiscriminating glutamyl-tRNA synthetase